MARQIVHAPPAVAPQGGPPPPVVDRLPRCDGRLPGGQPCRRVLAGYTARPWCIKCRRCGHVNVRDA